MVDNINNNKQNSYLFPPIPPRLESIEDYIFAWEVEVAQRQAYVLTYDVGISEVVQMSTRINLDRFNFPECDIRLKDMHEAIQASMKTLKEHGAVLPDVAVFNTLTTMANYTLPELKSFLIEELKKDLPELMQRFGLQGNFTPESFLIAIRKLYRTVMDPKQAHTLAPQDVKQLKEMDKYTLTDWVEKKLTNMLYEMTQPMQGQLWNHRFAIQDLTRNITEGRITAAFMKNAMEINVNKLTEVARSSPAA